MLLQNQIWQNNCDCKQRLETETFRSNMFLTRAVQCIAAIVNENKFEPHNKLYKGFFSIDNLLILDLRLF